MITNRRPLTIAIVAGETSGDILGAGLIRAIKLRVPNVGFIGIPGPLMQKEGCEVLYTMEELTAIGIIEVFKHMHRLLYIRASLTKIFSKLKPDMFIGIDMPDFNITLESNLKKLGIKTIHYVSPSIWAWRKKRILKINKAIDLILVLLPFEKVMYDNFNIPCRFVGHVMADYIPLDPDKNAARSILGIPHNTLCLSLLPGSRSIEIEMLSTNFLKATQIIYHSYPNINIVVPLVNKDHRKKFERIKDTVAPELKIKLLNREQSHIAMMASDVALLASGTATLECMLAKCPMVVGYRVNPITFWLAKFLIKTQYIALPNLLAERKIVQELLQNDCKPHILASALMSLLTDRESNNKMYNIFRELHQKIRCNANDQAADAILSLNQVNK